MSTETYCLQAACGENHSVFLLSNNTVMTCGSNEFGQLGLTGEAMGNETKNAQGGNEKEYIP
jgi:alpha-tubulin suppressor-like RCC1 family protein